LGLLDFNRQLEVLAPKPGKGQLKIQKRLIKPILGGIYAISEDLDSKYVLLI
jgi:lipoprotein-releasing system permease protein